VEIVAVGTLRRFSANVMTAPHFQNILVFQSLSLAYYKKQDIVVASGGGRYGSFPMSKVYKRSARPVI
jgi:hypothetical protein